MAAGAVVAGVVHFERVEDRFFHECRVGRPGRDFDDLAEHDVAGVAVLELLAGLEIERFVLEFGDQLVRAVTGFRSVFKKSGKLV